uniref:Uncharacterized protein n=1 Tax=Panagrolaimus davidi TaxID=227884 RepID=A0A914QEN5_9BILA
MKSCNISSAWTIFYPHSQLLICASGITSAFMNLFVIQNGLIHKLPRFEVDFGCSKIKPKLNDKDVMIASIYQILYLLVVKVDSTGMIRQINMYEIPSDISKPLQLAHVLLLHIDDNVGLHVIDNLVIVHHRTEANSYIFDIKVSDPSTTDHLPVLISPINVVNELSTSYGSETIFETYPWFILSPNIIVDTRYGIFADLQLQLKNASVFIKDRLR